MTDTPGPWRRIGREHVQRCGTYGAQAWCGARGIYRWRVYRAIGDRDFGALEESSAPTLAAAKRAATAALIRHAPMPF